MNRHIALRIGSTTSRAALLAALASITAPAPAQTAPSNVLFPVPFVVEHHVVQRDARGEEWRSELASDTYGGSFIVSTRANGDRTIIDLARRELTEVQAAKGTYWTLSFGRMAELKQRLRRADGAGRERAPETRARTESAPSTKIEDLGEDGGGAPRAALRAFESEALGSAAPAGADRRSAQRGARGVRCRSSAVTRPSRHTRSA